MTNNILFHGSLKNVLTNNQVRDEDIQIVRAEHEDTVTITVNSRYGIRELHYNVSKLLDKPQTVIEDLLKTAQWYHGGSIPKHRTAFGDVIESSRSLGPVFFAVMNVGIAMIVIALISWLIR